MRYRNEKLPRHKVRAELSKTVVCDDEMLHISLIAASYIIAVLFVKAVDIEVVFVQGSDIFCVFDDQ